MSEAPLRATLKAGVGYDAPWLGVDGNNPEELADRLEAITNGRVIEATINAANALKAANQAAPLLPQGQEAKHVSANTQPAPAGQSNGWGQAGVIPQSPPQQQGGGGWQGNAQTHPEGKQCDACGQPLEFKTTGSGKKVFRCPQWRWNNGNPNEHTQEWAS